MPPSILFSFESKQILQFFFAGRCRNSKIKYFYDNVSMTTYEGKSGRHDWTTILAATQPHLKAKPEALKTTQTRA